MSAMNQKDYLKKYLSIGKDSTEKKKKKKRVKSNIAPSRLVIIDDNADTFENAVKQDLLEDEDAPQIVAVIDDRPPSLRVDEKGNTNLWIPIGGKDENSLEKSSGRNQDLSDSSPPRNRVKLFSKTNDDISPPRKKQFSTNHNSDKMKDDRKMKKNEPISSQKKDSSKKSSRWESKDLDASPSKSKSAHEDDEYKRETCDDDNSPPRKRIRAVSPTMLNEEKTTKWQSDERDMSPPRKRSRGRTPEMVNRKRSSRWGSQNRDVSSSRQTYEDGKPKKKYSVEDNSPPRKRSEPSSSTKMMKTLDGKTAGLQNAKQLAVETSLIKEKEREIFNQMSSELSGANAKTIVRDRRTGRVRDFQEEAAREMEKKKKEDASKEKYSRWGKGLKQVEDATKRREEELNEMSKPLARYANDEDLEKYLKEQEREGDPMLAYIRKKKKKKDVEEGKPIKPEYMGEYMPNRFGIRPGHRWDGVDRSNGYEKNWFDKQNDRMAQLEELNKWNTEDM